MEEDTRAILYNVIVMDTYCVYRGGIFSCKFALEIIFEITCVCVLWRVDK